MVTDDVRKALVAEGSPISVHDFACQLATGLLSGDEFLPLVGIEPEHCIALVDEAGTLSVYQSKDQPMLICVPGTWQRIRRH